MPRALVSRILTLAGWDVVNAPPPAGAYCGRWSAAGCQPQPRRLLMDAAPLRLHPEGDGPATLGLIVDHLSAPLSAGHSGIVRLLQNQPLEIGDLETRAESAIERMRASHLSQLGAALPDIPAPAPEAVLRLGLALLVIQKDPLLSTAAMGATAALMAWHWLRRPRAAAV